MNTKTFVRLDVHRKLVVATAMGVPATVGSDTPLPSVLRAGFRTRRRDSSAAGGGSERIFISRNVKDFSDPVTLVQIQALGCDYEASFESALARIES